MPETLPFIESPLNYGDANLSAYQSGITSYTAENVTEEIHFDDTGISANTGRKWIIPCTLKPQILWVQELNLNQNKTLTWTIYNSEDTPLWIVPITFGDMIAQGNTSYYLFPNMTIETGWKGEIISSVALTSVKVIAVRNVHIIKKIAPIN